VAGILIGAGGSRLQELEAETGRRFAFDTKEDLPGDHFAVLAEGPAAEIEQQGLPVTAGQELMVKLEAPHLHDEHAAIARLDGYVISVADAADKVGKRMKIRIERATRTSAYAVLTSARKKAAPVQAADLAELPPEEAPKPRRSRAKKPAEAAPPPDAEAEAAAEAVAEGETAREGDAPAGEEKPKKRTRRGSRGGRGRKKKPALAADGAAATEAAGEDGSEPSEAVAAEEQPAEPEPVPAEELESVDGAGPPTETEEKPRKKTRRGSRGGRNRRRRPAAANGDGAAPEAGEPDEGLEVAAEPEVATFAAEGDDG
jgi:predicted RNA-binding protein with TRAM domain